jgi:hypothetical protein
MTVVYMAMTRDYSSYYSEGGYTVPYVQYIHYEATRFSTAIPNDGYKFVGWYIAPDPFDPSSFNPNSLDSETPFCTNPEFEPPDPKDEGEIGEDCRRNYIALFEKDFSAAYQIWNWEDLAYLNVLIENDKNGCVSPCEKLSDYNGIAVLMQDLGFPDGGNYGDGSEMVSSPQAVRDRHPGDKRFGWYGYEGFTGAADITVHYDLVDDVELRDTKATAAYIGWTPVIDIDCGWNGTEGWIPIGTASIPFTDEFEGNKNSINGLWIDSNGNDQGLFGYADNAIIERVGVNIADDAAVKGTDNVGGLIGYAQFTTITSCYVTGEVNGHDVVGGLAGYIDNTSISICYATGDVSGNKDIGGLVGKAVVESEILYCYATGTITGTGVNVGGLVGSAGLISEDYTTIAYCYATGMVTGYDKVGGILGYSWNLYVQINHCFALNPELTSTTNRPNTGRICSDTNMQSIFNYALGCMLVDGEPLDESIYDDSNNGADVSVGEVVYPEELTYTSIGIPGAGWDFDDIWTFDYDYSSPSNEWRVTPITELPILRAFDLGFSHAVQPPHLLKASISIDKEPAVCAGVEITLTAIITNGGPLTSPPEYQWKNNGVDIPGPDGTKATYTFTPKVGDNITCKLTPGICVYPKTVESEAVTVVPPPTLTLAKTNITTCVTKPIEVTGNTFTNADGVSIIKVNGQGLLTFSDPTISAFSITYLPDEADEGTTVKIAVTTVNDPPCEPVTDTLKIAVIAEKTPIFAGIQLTYCEGETPNPTPLPTTSDNGIIGHWEDESETTVEDIETSTPTTTPDIYTFVPDANQCVVSTNTTIEVTVKEKVIPTITIDGSPTICEGSEEITLKISITGGGSAPEYQWTKNGVDVTDSINATFTFVPAEDDIITCKLTSNADCANPTTVESDPVTVEVCAGCENEPEIELNETKVVTCGTTPVTVTGTFDYADEIKLSEDYLYSGNLELTLGEGSEEGTFTIEYTPHATDIGEKIEIVVIATSINPKCEIATDTLWITVNNPSTLELSAGAKDQTLCHGFAMTESE